MSPQHVSVAALCLLCGLSAVRGAEHEVPPVFRMRVEQCRRTETGLVTLTTTGAVFALDPSHDRIGVRQRIGVSRRVAWIAFPAGTLRGLRVASRNDTAVEFTGGALETFRIHGDSVLEVTSRKTCPVRIDATFQPEYLANEPGATMVLDDAGGFCALFWSATPIRARVNRGDDDCELRNALVPGTTFLLGVCPPRPYNWRQYRDERIVHFFPELTKPGQSPRPLPTREELTAWRAIGNVLVLHLEAWKGFGVARIKPVDPAAFRETVRTAHELGYLVLPYSSCYYYKPARIMSRKKYWTPRRWRDNAVDLYLEEARWLLNEYGVDGLYWDGYFSDPLKAWDCARRTRNLLGDMSLYVHCTNSPLMRPGVFCPFADAYCDYILRGEGRPRDRVVNPIYIRYQVSGLNISNAIGTLCYDTCRIDPELIEWVLQAGARIPYWPGKQTHNGRRYFLLPDEERLYRTEYLPRLLNTGPEKRPRLAVAGLATRDAWRKQQAQRRQRCKQALMEHLRAQKARIGATDNLAAFVVPTCSDACVRWPGPHGLGSLPVYATDGDPDTFWAADYPPQWLEVDLGSVRRVQRIHLLTYWKDIRFYHYRIAVSADGVRWDTVAVKLDDTPATAAGRTWEFPPRKARYVRVTMLQNSANPGVHISELEVFR